MDRLRPEDQKTLQLLFRKAKELDEEFEREANDDDYREMQALFAADEEKLENETKQVQIQQSHAEQEILSKEEEEEQGQIIEELQKELSPDELFTNDSDANNKQKKQDQVCILCSKKDPKYCCPGCSRRTCSLACSQEHKKKFSCSGKINYTGVVSKQEYGDKNAQKDYQYLRRTLEGTEFIRKKLSFALHNPELLRLKLLKIYARKKHRIELFFAPTIMTRHRENLSFYYMKTKLIFWELEVLFVSFEKKEEEGKAIEEHHEVNNNQEQKEENQKHSNSKEILTRKLIDPVSENTQWKDVLRKAENNLFDENLLLKWQIDNSVDGMSKQLDANDVSLFVKNRFRISDLLEIKEKESQNNYPLPFTIPENIMQTEVPSQFKEKENFNRDFQVQYEMVQIPVSSLITSSLVGAKINEFPTLYVVNAQFREQFQSKYKCLLLQSQILAEQ